MTVDWKQVEDHIRQGGNPVDVAGYGRESTHKGYLSWMLNADRWPGAHKALGLLLERASWPHEEAKKQGLAWFRTRLSQRRLR